MLVTDVGDGYTFSRLHQLVTTLRSLGDNFENVATNMTLAIKNPSN